MGIKEERLNRKLARREERNAKYSIAESEANIKTLENEVMILLTHRVLGC